MKTYHEDLSGDEEMTQTTTTASGVDIAQSITRAKATVLSVQSGVHQGAELVAENQIISVGTNPENDLVLFAEDMADHHFKIELNKNPLGDLTVHAVNGAITINADRLLNPGEYCKLQSGFEIEANGCRIQVARGLDVSKFAVPAIKAGMLVAALIFAWLIWTIMSSIVGNVAQVGHSVLGQVAETLKVEENLNRIGIGGTSQSDGQMNEALRVVRERLETLNLNTMIRANITSDDLITVNGNVGEEYAKPWNEFLRWYDVNPSLPRLIRQVTRNEVAKDLPVIKSIWFENPPSVLLGDGTFAKVGDEVTGNWRILSIEKSSIVIERDGANVTLSY